jgi:hypothetical protein
MAMRLLAAALLVAALAGCGPSLPPVPPGEVVSYARDVEPLVIKRCVGCHAGTEAKAGLVLEPGKGYGDLVGRPSTQAPNVLLVVPGDPEASYLWRKLEGTTAVGKGMPRGMLGFRALPPEELNRIRRWIEEGARP